MGIHNLSIYRKSQTLNKVTLTRATLKLRRVGPLLLISIPYAQFHFILTITLLYRQGNWSPERLSNLRKVTKDHTIQLVLAPRSLMPEAATWSQAVLCALPSPFLLLLSSCDPILLFLQWSPFSSNSIDSDQYILKCLWWNGKRYLMKKGALVKEVWEKVD